MGLFPQQFIDDLRLQANILQVVQEYVPLKRSGARYTGLCPFHNEKSPSFGVNPEKGFFHCFGCGAGGDVFKFLELHEKVGFQEAVRMLAQKFGVALPEPADGEGDDVRFDLSEVATNLRKERYRKNGETWWQKAIASDTVQRLYYFLRPVMGVGVRKHLQKASLSGWDKIAFPRWPVDVTVDTLMESAMTLALKAQGTSSIPFIWFWPDDSSAVR
jgi:DNA primase